MAFQTWHDVRLMHGIDILMLIPMTLTLMQGHSGSAQEKNELSYLILNLPQRWAILYMTLTVTLKMFIWLDHLRASCFYFLFILVSFTLSLLKTWYLDKAAVLGISKPACLLLLVLVLQSRNSP